MEEARGETFLWNELRNFFIKDFSFTLEDEKLVEATKQIKKFVQHNTSKSTQNSQLNASCQSI